MMVEGEEEDKEMTNPSDATIEPIFDRILEKYLLSVANFGFHHIVEITESCSR